MSVDTAVHQTVSRKQLHSMHQDLSDWSLLLQNKEKNNSIKDNSTCNASSSVHESIGIFSQKYRPLSVTFQQWQSNTSDAEEGGKINRVESKKLAFLHTEIVSFAHKLESASKENSTFKVVNGIHVSKAFPSINDLEDIISPSHELSNDESCDDPFSAKLDDVLNSEEHTLQFTYSGTPPNSPSFGNLNFLNHEVFGLNQDSLHMVATKLSSNLSLVKNSSSDSSIDLIDSSAFLRSVNAEETSLTSKTSEENKLQNESECKSTSVETLKLAGNDCIKEDNKDSMQLFDSLNDKTSDIEEALMQDLKQTKNVTSKNPKNINRKSKISNKLHYIQNSSTSSIEDAEIGIIEQDNSYVTYEEKIEIFSNSHTCDKTSAKNEFDQNDFPLPPSTHQLNELNDYPEKSPTKSDNANFEEADVKEDISIKLTPVSDSCSYVCDTVKVIGSPSKDKENKVGLDHASLKEVRKILQQNNEINYESVDAKDTVDEILTCDSEKLILNQKMSNVFNDFHDKTIEASNQLSTKSKYETLTPEEISETKTSIKPTFGIFSEEKEVFDLISDEYHVSQTRQDEKHLQLKVPPVTIVESISINRSQPVKTILVEERLQPTCENLPFPKTIFVEEKQYHVPKENQKNLAIQTQPNLSESSSGEEVVHELICDRDHLQKNNILKMSSSSNMALSENKTVDTKVESTSVKGLELGQRKEVYSEANSTNSEVTVDPIVVKKVILTPLNSIQEKKLLDAPEDIVLNVSAEEPFVKPSLDLTVKSKTVEKADVNKENVSNENMADILSSFQSESENGNSMKENQHCINEQIQKTNKSSSSNNVLNLNNNSSKRVVEKLKNNFEQTLLNQDISLTEKDLINKSKFQLMQQRKKFETCRDYEPSTNQTNATVRQTNYVLSAKTKLIGSSKKEVVTPSKPSSPTNDISKFKIFSEESPATQRENVSDNYTSPRPLFTAKPFDLKTKRIKHIKPPTLGVREKTKMFQKNIDTLSSPTSPSSRTPTIPKSTSSPTALIRADASKKETTGQVNGKNSIEDRPAVPSLPNFSALADVEVLPNAELKRTKEKVDLFPPPIPALPDLDY